VVNLTELAERWGRTHHMSVYLRDGAAEEDIAKLTGVLRDLPAISKVEYVSAASAREQFLKDALTTGGMEGLPVQVFPASLEVEFVPKVSDKRIQEVAEQVAAFKAAVEEVDTYRSWFERLGALISAGRMAAAMLGGLVLICVFAVVSNTIRLAVASRRDEIEILKMCGATDAFVRGPFVLEGTLQGLVAAATSLAILLGVFLAFRGQIDATLAPLAGMRLSFLSPLLVVGVLLAGAITGALGSALSIRRYLSV
jgi:cell division transport system permease protein